MNVDPHITYLSRLKVREADAYALLKPWPSLPAFLKSLLVADGTVTTMLGAYFDEKISVLTDDQTMLRLTQNIDQLHLRSGDEGFIRSVRLLGADSAREFASATSLLNPANMPPNLFSELIAEHVGMGEVLRNSARGSFRQILSIEAQEEGQIQRTYRVSLEGKPVILITENFNIGCFN